MTHADARAHFGPTIDQCTRLSDAEADRLAGPEPEGYRAMAVPELSPDIPPRSAERLASLKRETIKTVKELGKLQNGKPVNYEWAFYAVHMIAQRIISPEGMAIDEEADEAKLVAVHNEATKLLKKAQEKAANAEGRGGPPFR